MIIEENNSTKPKNMQDTIALLDEDDYSGEKVETKLLNNSLNTIGIKETQESTEIKDINSVIKEEKDLKDKIDENTTKNSIIKNEIKSIDETKDYNLQQLKYIKYENSSKEIENIRKSLEFKEIKYVKEKEEDKVINNKEELKVINENEIKVLSKPIDININIKDVSDLKEYKIYCSNSSDLYVVKVGKYLDTNIILLCIESKEATEPNFYYQSVYSLDDLVARNKIFLLYKKNDKLHKLFLKIFNNKNVKVTKDTDDPNYINLIMKLIMPDGENSMIMLKLIRKEKEKDEAFYDAFISFEKELERENEKKKYLNSFGDEKNFTYDVGGINYDHQIVDKDAKIKKKIQKMEEENKENIKEEKNKKVGNRRNVDDETLLHEFNKKYKTRLKLKDKELYLYEKGLLSESVSKLSKIHFRIAEELYLNNNKISSIDGLINSNFNNLKILSVHDNNISKIGQLANCSFIPKLTELYLYNNKLQNLDEFSGCNFDELSILHLFNNNLVNIDGLGYCNFKKITKLLLYNNKIENIDKLANCNFSTLKVLSLYNNKITNIDALGKCNLENLNEILLNKNKISNIDCLVHCNLSNLNLLVLHNNKLNNIDAFDKCNFRELRTLFLYSNRFSKNTQKNLKIIEDLKHRNKYLSVFKW